MIASPFPALAKLLKSIFAHKFIILLLKFFMPMMLFLLFDISSYRINLRLAYFCAFAFVGVY
jgi:hypothetical protein